MSNYRDRKEYYAARRANRTDEQIEAERARKAAYYAANKERCLALSKRSRERNREKYRAISLAWYQRNKEQVAMRKAGVIVDHQRPSECSVCGRTGRIVLDHCHQLRRFRGWLCASCNSALGLAGESPQILRALASYVESHLELQE